MRSGPLAVPLKGHRTRGVKMKPAIYTEKTECRDCYKCVRECPVKAIRVKDSSATIDHDRCIFCGRCVHVCPSNAKRVRRDIPRARQLLALKEKVFVSLAPSFPTYFTQSSTQLVKDLMDMGFAGVSETALGADIITQLQNQLFEERENKDTGDSTMSHAAEVLFSSACPPVVELIRKYYPDMTENLSPFHSPMVAHGKLLRAYYGKNIGVVFIGPCIAKKHEADQYPDVIDVALTFEEAAELLKAERTKSNDIIPEITITRPVEKGNTLLSPTSNKAENRSELSFSPPCVPPFVPSFVPFRAGSARLFPIEGGMKATMQENSCLSSSSVFVQSGIHTIQKNLTSYSHYRGKTKSFCELLACPGGCIDGCGFHSEIPLAERHLKVVAFSEEQTTSTLLNENSFQDILADDFYRAYIKAPPKEGYTYTDIEIQDALRRLGKSHPEDLKDCGGCGYNTCREFAAAWLAGMAEKEMCVTEMRKLAQKKANALIQRIPLGIALIDSENKIVECNARFLSLFWDFDDEPTEEEVTRMYGSSITNFIDEPQLFRTVFSSRISKEQIVRTKNKVLESHCFSIQPGRLIGVTLHDITTSSVKRSMVVKKAEEVIRKNLSSVQQIAGLLGENAAETEILLNQLIETFDPDNIPQGEAE